MALVELKTDLRSLRSEFYTDRKPYVSTNLPADFNAAPPKTPNTLELAAERRRDDASRLVQLLASGRGVTFLSKQALLSYKESGKIGQALRDVAAIVPTLVTQAGLSGTGFHGSVDMTTGNTFFPKTAVDTSFLNRKTLIPDNKFENDQILPGILEIRDKPKRKETYPLADVGYRFGSFPKTGITPQELERNYESSDRARLVGNTTQTLNNGFIVQRKKQLLLSTLQRTNAQPLSVDSKIVLETRIGLGKFNTEFIRYSGFKEAIDEVNYLDVQTGELDTYKDIIPFKIVIREPGVEAPYYLYFRAYLDSFSEAYNGTWNGTKYIGRAEEVFNYNGFSREVSFGFKIAATSESELLPLYKKLNYLAGTTAPSYSDTFMRGVFVELTVGDYLIKTPGFFTNVRLNWDVNYPWEIKEGVPGVQGVSTSDETPSLPHILDVSVSFTPVHDFAPQFKSEFIGNGLINKNSKERDSIDKANPKTTYDAVPSRGEINSVGVGAGTVVNPAWEAFNKEAKTRRDRELEFRRLQASNEIQAQYPADGYTQRVEADPDLGTIRNNFLRNQEEARLERESQERYFSRDFTNGDGSQDLGLTQRPSNEAIYLANQQRKEQIRIEANLKRLEEEGNRFSELLQPPFR